MKTLYRIALAAIFTMGLTACDDFLDSEPKSSVDPDKYFTEASQLQTYANEIYHVFFRAVIMDITVPTISILTIRYRRRLPTVSLKASGKFHIRKETGRLKQFIG